MFSPNAKLDEEYDFIIVGAGPAGLAFAQCCVDEGKKVVLIEKESDIGGCHRVRRVAYKGEMLFTEHGPRVYSDAYKVTKMLFEKMGKSFDEVFVPYNFQMSVIGSKTIWEVMNFREMVVLCFAYVCLLMDSKFGQDISMEQLMDTYNFTAETRDMIDRLCRLTDGAESSRYTVSEFLSLFDQQFLYKLYQPRLSNDRGMFKWWKEYLERKGARIVLNRNVEEVLVNGDKIVGVRMLGDNVRGKAVVLAVPPYNLYTHVLPECDNIVRNAFGDFNQMLQWSVRTKYIDYLSITFHYKSRLELPKVYGFPRSDWGVAHIVVTDYTTLEETQSQTVISTAITINSKRSRYNNKTANECTEDELKEQVLAQLRESYKDLPDPDVVLLSPGVYRNNGEWLCKDTAYVASSKELPRFPYASASVSNLYNIGTQNGRHVYSFTSMESAVTNAIVLAHELMPNTKRTFPVSSAVRVSLVIRVILLFVILYKVFA